MRLWLGILAACGETEPEPPSGEPVETLPTEEPPSGTAPAFSSDWAGMLAFFDVHCVRCHSDPYTYPRLPEDVADVVVPFDPEASTLWRVVSGALGPLDFAEMPLDVGLLPEAQTGHVRAWILAGAVGDADGDGFDADDDCDDADALVFPGAPEVCDGTDEDCDGAVDEDAIDATLFFEDSDGDGFGAGTGALACAATDATSALDGDCDDADAATFPGAPEACTDPLDRSCDAVPGLVDADADGFAACLECDDARFDLAATPTWYRDADEDGAGAPLDAVAACDPPAGYVASFDDCDDANPTISPLEPERCNTVDDDCDLLVDEDDAIDPAAWYVDGDGDGFGDGAPILACAGPPGSVAVDGDCDDASAAFAPGAPEACTDVDDFNCDGALGFVDNDGDGFAACEECDDGDADVSPAAIEVCNGIDDDCSGSADADAADATNWYADADGDGFGSGAPVGACVAPALHVAADGDCDEQDPTVNPLTVWFVDGDGDGFGAGAAIVGCLAPPSGVRDGSDCDDADATRFPAAPELCTDPVDRDCDGSPGAIDGDGDGVAACVECDDANPAVGEAPSWYPDLDSDGYGDDAGAVAACAAPPGLLAIGGDCSDGEVYVHPGAALDPTDGRDNDCDGALDEDGPLSHAADIQPLWDASCLGGCHENPGASGGLDLAAPAHGRIVGVASGDVPSMSRIEPLFPDDSYIWHKLHGTQAAVGGSGVDMPKLAPQLPEDELALIEAWIVGGALP